MFEFVLGVSTKEESVRNKPFAVLLFSVLVAVLLCAIPALAENWSGTDGPDDHTGTTAKDMLKGLGGSDRLRGLDGNDNIHGGAGADIIDPGAGVNTIKGGDGDDHIKATANPDGSYDTINCGLGFDFLYITDSFQGTATGCDVIDYNPWQPPSWPVQDSDGDAWPNDGAYQDQCPNEPGTADGCPAPPPPPPPAACADGLDNDGDGAIDLADPGCVDAADTNETELPPPPPPPACADGVDNDGDGAADLADPGCADAADNDETNAPPPPAGGSVTGEFKKWHPVTVSFTGPSSTETNSSPNPFLDYRLQVSFTSPSGKSFEVPGFYDGDGNGGSSGSVWKVRFNPDESGTWGYKASFRQGTNVAIDTSATAGSPTSFDGTSGTFDIAARDSAAPGFLSQGLLEYANGHYLKFRDGSYYLKGGADSPENWLGYAGFDNTPTAKHSFAPHVQDWQTGDPIFNPSSADGGKGFIGALNYLSSQGINSIYFLPMNIGGDARDTSPYINVSNWAGSSSNDNYHFDVSKLGQWEQAFAHAQRKGIHLHFVLNEAEGPNKQELDGGMLGNERKLFYREMVARFAHHNALQWNVSEEYDLDHNLGSDNVKAFAGYIQSIDPYDHPITVHQSGNPDTTWTPFLGDSRFSSTSFQYWNSYAGYGAEVEEWRSKTASAGRPLPIGMDEVISATTTNAADMRRGVLWPTYLSGGNLEWYIGSEDQSLEDFRRYGELWAYTRHARTFMEANLPFWEMQPQDGLLLGESSDYGGGQVFAKASEVYAVYLPNATSTGTLDLSSASGSFQKRWYNPRSGAFEGSAQAVSGGAITSLGAPPSSTSSDWVVLIEAIG